MKLYYIAAAPGCQIAGTQAEAKALARDAGVRFDAEADTIDVPTDKEGLIGYLNRLIAAHQVVGVGPTDPDTVVKDVNEDIHPERAPSYTERSLGLDAAFEAAPLAHRLTLAALALEEARALCPTLVTSPAEVDPLT